MLAGLSTPELERCVVGTRSRQLSDPDHQMRDGGDSARRECAKCVEGLARSGRGAALAPPGGAGSWLAAVVDAVETAERQQQQQQQQQQQLGAPGPLAGAAGAAAAASTVAAAPVARSGRRGSSSRFRGVSWDRAHKNWQARLYVPGEKVHYLGHHGSEEAAGRAYDAEVRRRNLPNLGLYFLAEGEAPATAAAPVARWPSGFRGVSLHKQSAKWQARLCLPGKKLHCLDLHASEEAAAWA